MNRTSKHHAADYDVAIIGGGLVGASLACALGSTGVRCLVVEAHPPESDAQPSFDERTVALTDNARRIFTGMGVWSAIARQHPQPIRDIHISSSGELGQTHLSHRDAKTEALGFVVPTRVLGNALWENMRGHSNIDLCCPAKALAAEDTGDLCSIKIGEAKESRCVTASLLVLADGGRSGLDELLGFTATRSPYSQSAILCMVGSDRNHQGRAYERFTREGPLALLPLGNNGEAPANGCCYAVVWTSSPENTAQRMSMDDNEFIAALQQAFGDRAGSFFSPTKRNSYPLTRDTLDQPAAGRVIVIGNAAHAVHPVAGQGFNLGLRDVASLAEIIAAAPQEKMGSSDMRTQYLSTRERDVRMVSGFTHGLISLFGSSAWPVARARSIGLGIIEHSPALKRFLLRRTMGLSGKPTRLSLGLPLEKRSGHPGNST